MKKSSYMSAVVASLLFMVSLLSACAGGNILRTEPVQDPRSIRGTYTLILYQEKDYFGLLTIAFLAAEGYTFKPYAPDYNYGVTEHVDGREALESAKVFIGNNPDYMSSSISSILDPAGKIIGYEIMPLYRSFNYGVSNVMTVSYTLKDSGIVQINLELLSRVKNDINGS